MSRTIFHLTQFCRTHGVMLKMKSHTKIGALRKGSTKQASRRYNIAAMKLRKTIFSGHGLIRKSKFVLTIDLSGAQWVTFTSLSSHPLGFHTEIIV